MRQGLLKNEAAFTPDGFKAIVTEVTDTLVVPDSFRINHVILTTEFAQFWSGLLKIYIKHAEVLVADIHLSFQTLVKCIIVKSNFRFLKKTLSLILRDFKLQIQTGAPQPYNPHLFALLSTIVSNPIILPADRYFFLSTNVGECLEVDMPRVRALKESIPGLSLFCVIHTDFKELPGENYLISKMNLSDSVSIKIRFNDDKMELLVFKRTRLLGEFTAFEKVSEMTRKNYNFFSVSINSGSSGWMVLIGLNGQYYLQTLASERPEVVNTNRMKLEMFENMSISLNCLGFVRRFLDKNLAEKIRLGIGTNGIGSLDSLRKFYDDFGGLDAVLLNGLSRVKMKSGAHHFKDHKLDKGFTFTGYLNVVETRQHLIDNQLISSDLVGKLLIALAFCPEKDAIVRLVLSQCRNINLIRLAALFVGRDYLAELKSAMISTNFGQHMSPFVARVIPNLVENETNPFLGQILNRFVLSFEILSLLSTQELVAEFFQHLLICFDRNAPLSDLLDFDQFQKTILKFFKNDADEHATLKLAKLANLGEIVTTHLGEPESLDISPLLTLFGCTNFPQTDLHKCLYKFILKLIGMNKGSSKNKDSVNSYLSNFLRQITDTALIRKVVKLMLVINEANPQPLVLAWRIKFVPGLSLTNVFDTYHKYVMSKNKLVDCGRLWDGLKRFVFDRSIRDSTSADFGKWADPKLTSLVFEMSLVFDSETLKVLLLNLTLSIKQYPKEFMTNISPHLFFLWILTVLQHAHVDRKSEPVYDLALKLLTSYLVETIARRQTIRNFRSFFYIASWLEEIKESQAGMAEAVALVFKSFVQKGIKIEKEADFCAFLTIVFVFFCQTAHKKEPNAAGMLQWNWILVFIDRCLNDPSKKNLLSEITKQISKTITQPGIKILFFKQGFDSANQNYKTSVLHMLTLMVFEVSRALVAQNNEEYIKNVSAFFGSTFETFYLVVERNRQILFVEQVLDLDRFLVELLRFVSVYPMIHGAISEIIKAAKQLKPRTDGFLAKFWGASMVALTDEGELRKWIENLAFDGTFDFQSREELEKIYALEIRQCRAEAETALIQEDSLQPKFDESLELFVSKNYSPLGELQISQKLQKQTLFDSLRVETVIERHTQRHSFRKSLKSAHEQTRYLFPKELGLKVYKTVPNQSGEFDSERLEGLHYKHRNLLNRELQKPFLKLRTKKILAVPPEPCTLPLPSQYERYIQQNKLFVYVSTWVKRFSLIGGYLYIHPVLNTINFLVNQALHQKRKNPIELVEFKPNSDTKLIYSWRVAEIYEIHDYKFLQKRCAIEIFFTNSKSEIFCFESKTLAEQFCRQALKNAQAKTPKITDPTQLFKTNSYQKKWEGERISNFKYLMLVNAHASRSLGDFSQYPVFPVVIKRIEDTAWFARDLDKPIGIVGDEKRRDAFIQRLQQFSSFNKGPSYNFGSHYSSPAIVLSFLIRLRPYERGCLAIQNGTFDLPDRLFFSIKSTLRNIMNDISDVREFIPELFYLPAMFFNLNHFDFGKNQSNMRVHDVIIPEMFNSNAYRFIFGLRKLLESETVSSSLGKWIDLIFGTVQLGEKARKANNVFYHLTYEGCMNEVETTDPDSLEATENQIYHFGQTPFQLFSGKHSNRTEFSPPKNLINNRSNCIFRQLVNIDGATRTEHSYFIKKMKSEDFENGHLIFHVKKTHVVLYRYIDTFIFSPDNQTYKVNFEEIIPIARIKSAYFDPGAVDYRADGVVEILPDFKLLLRWLFERENLPVQHETAEKNRGISLPPDRRSQIDLRPDRQTGISRRIRTDRLLCRGRGAKRNRSLPHNLRLLRPGRPFPVFLHRRHRLLLLFDQQGPFRSPLPALPVKSAVQPALSRGVQGPGGADKPVQIRPLFDHLWVRERPGGEQLLGGAVRHRHFFLRGKHHQPVLDPGQTVQIYPHVRYQGRVLCRLPAGHKRKRRQLSVRFASVGPGSQGGRQRRVPD
jgi:hypothetical protein